MTKTIWKFVFNLSNGDVQQQTMPVGAEILSIAFQQDDLCIWALVDLGVETETRQFVMFGTGRPIVKTDSLKYIGTADLTYGRAFGVPLVIHLFEDKSK